MADVILEFSQVSVEADVSNHEIIGRDYIARRSSFDWINRKLRFFGDLSDLS